MEIKEYFRRLVPKVNYYSLKRDPEQSYFTLTNVIGPLPLNTTAMQISDLCDDTKSIYEIFEQMRKIYPDVEEKILFRDVTKCIRNYEIIGAMQVRVI